MNHANYLDNVPREILFEILSHLSLKDFLTTPLISKKYKTTADDINYWIKAVTKICAKHTDSKMTPLYIAAAIGQSEIVKKLIADDADVNELCILKINSKLYSVSSLSVAIKNGHTDIVEVLLKNGAKITEVFNPNHFLDYFDTMPSIFCAVKKGHTAVLKVLLENVKNVNLEEEWRNQTLLSIAVDNGDLESVKVLLEKNAKIDGYEPASLLYTAIIKGHTDVALLLLEKGANATVGYYDETNWYISPLYAAAKHGHAQIVAALLEQNVDVDAGYLDEREQLIISPLYAAAKNGHTIVVNLLLEHHADINNDKESTVFSFGSLESIFSNHTPLAVAKKNGHIDSVKVIEQYQEALAREKKEAAKNSISHKIISTLGITRNFGVGKNTKNCAESEVGVELKTVAVKEKEIKEKYKEKHNENNENEKGSFFSFNLSNGKK